MTVGIVIEVEVNPDRMDEFSKMIKNNAIISRQEEGNLRFDVIKVKGIEINL